MSETTYWLDGGYQRGRAQYRINSSRVRTQRDRVPGMVRDCVSLQPITNLCYRGGPSRQAASGRGSRLIAKVAELVDALDLGSRGATRESSSLSFRTILMYRG